VGRAEFRVAFNTFDADRSGTIETHELLKVRKVGGECRGVQSVQCVCWCVLCVCCQVCTVYFECPSV
jgi:hypothetical protein